MSEASPFPQAVPQPFRGLLMRSPALRRIIACTAQLPGLDLELVETGGHMLQTAAQGLLPAWPAGFRPARKSHLTRKTLR
jgi:hypothetical protein